MYKNFIDKYFVIVLIFGSGHLLSCDSVNAKKIDAEPNSRSILKKESQYNKDISDQMQTWNEARKNFVLISEAISEYKKSLQMFSDDELILAKSSLCSPMISLNDYLFKKNNQSDAAFFDALPCEVRAKIIQSSDNSYFMTDTCHYCCCCLPRFCKGEPVSGRRQHILKVVEEELKRCSQIEELYKPKTIAPSKKKRASLLIVDSSQNIT